MVNPNSQNENTQNEFSYTIKKLEIGKLLHQSNITKNCGILAFDRLTKPNRVKTFVLDDHIVKRNRNKKVELLARVYDYVEHKFRRGLSMPTLGWSDGYKCRKDSMLSKLYSVIYAGSVLNKSIIYT